MPKAHLTLVAFRVTNFRSVRDSGWIEADHVTALIGTNEAGKTNLLLPLWKLNPATKEGAVKLLTDAPRRDYSAYKNLKKKPVFITAKFTLSPELAGKVAAKTGVAVEKVQTVEVSRDLGGDLAFKFPDATPARSVAKAEVDGPILAARKDIDAMEPADEADTGLKPTILAAMDAMIAELQGKPDQLGPTEASGIHAAMNKVDLKTATPQSTIAPRFRQAIKAVEAIAQKLGKAGPNDNADAQKLVKDHLPTFVYYSTYGNLDSEIYLPHVIDNLKRTDLSGKDEARARTLRVLFGFVRLKPEEILELGQDWDEQKGKANESQIQAFAEKKKERSVLLQSAGTELTTKFREWWKQGNYRIKFEADGNHFRIWVSDEVRPEEIELELRSSGLQWFLSFYLIFLVESAAAHQGAILLLDEPGHTLHPIAQRDLAEFFDSLSDSNQLIYTTHSPFLVDADHLDRVRAVYVDDVGFTAVSTDLRAGQAAARSKSIYPVHAALGLSVCDTLFQGCRPIVVEGQSDQLFLSGIKTILVALGKIRPSRELLFVPTSGVKAIKTVASILAGRDEDLPLVLCDADNAGKSLATSVKENLYKDVPDRVLLVSDFTGTDGTQIEDLFPWAFLGPIIDRYILKGPDDQPFTPDASKPSIVDQVKDYAARHKLELAEGWKVDLARLVKARLTIDLAKNPDWTATVAVWEKLFQRLAGPEAETPPAAGTRPATDSAAKRPA